MGKKEFVALGIRMAAIFYIVRYGIPPLYSLPELGEHKISVYINIAILAIFLLISLLLLKFPLLFAGALLPKTNQDDVASTYHLEDIRMVAFTILGLYVLVTSIPDLFYWLIVVQQHRSNNLAIEWRPEDLGSMASTLVELILGIWLLFGAKGLQGLLYKFRYAGIDK